MSELYVLNNSVNKVIAKEGFKVHRALVGNYMTSLDMEGASITFLKLDDELKALLDAPVNTPALTWGEAASEEAEAALVAVRALAKAMNVVPAAKEECAEKAETAKKPRRLKRKRFTNSPKNPCLHPK